ncbi:MAG: tail fiber protein [bacterium]|nr:tail fiber protein [bacterium]
MKQFFYFYILSLFLVASFAFSGCEAGLNSSDSSSEKTEIDEFSFSEMYKNIRELKITVADLQSQITDSSSREVVLQNNISTLQNEITSLKEVSAPVGSIQAWDKNLAGTPDIPAGWVECNGQVVSDAESVYNGVAVPDLNSEGRFLRGGSSSGNWEEDATAVNGLSVNKNGDHNHTSETTIYNNCREDNDSNSSCNRGSFFNNNYFVDNFNVVTTINHYYTYSTYKNFKITSNSTGSHSHSLSGDSETRPTNMSVVWIMRIK